MSSNEVWDSPISSEVVASASLIFEDLASSKGQIFWTESRPSSSGRYCLVSFSQDMREQTLLDQINVKSRVHEYGGGAISCDQNWIYFVNDTSKSICRFDIETKEVQTLYANDLLRVAEIQVHPSKKIAYFIGEDIHNKEDIINAIYSLDLIDKIVHKVHSKHDFYSSIKISHAGDKLAFTCWDFPHMQWDQSSVHLVEISEDLCLLHEKKIAGYNCESAFQPSFSSKGLLYYISDRLGYWSLYQYDGRESLCILPLSGDIGQPQWKLGRYFYVEALYENELGFLCSLTQQASDKLVFISNGYKKIKEFTLPFTSITHLVKVDHRKVCFFGASAVHSKSVIIFDLEKEEYTIIKSCFAFPYSKDWISIPRQISFPSINDVDETYAFYYLPKNPLTYKPDPIGMIVRTHGGPTGHNPPVFNQEILFWTSRGFAYLDVNYSGSSGYGRKYRDRLIGQWGNLDVKEAILAAEYVIKQGWLQSKNIFIKGSSSGGLTALMAMTESEIFTACTSYYGVLDLQALASDTHKFEKHYLDSLLGVFPREKKLYQERAPIDNVEKICKPVLLLQGRNDMVVLPAQSEKLYLKLRERHIQAELVLFDDEGHGFRKKETIKFCLEKELAFYTSLLV